MKPFSFTRTTTLNDIYRNLGMNQKGIEERKLKRQDQYVGEAAVDYKDGDYMEEGDVTGFMVEKPLTPSSGINSFDVSSHSCCAFFRYSLDWNVKANTRLCIFQQFSLPQASAGAKTGKLLSVANISDPFSYIKQNSSRYEI